MVELVDSLASGASARKGVRVRLPPRAPRRDIRKDVPFALAIVAETVFFIGCNLSFHGNRFLGRFRPVQSVLAKFASELVGERSVEVGGGRAGLSFKYIFLL